MRNALTQLLLDNRSRPVPGLVLPFADAGAGTVTLTPERGLGAASFTRATTAWTRLSNGLLGSVASGAARSWYLPDGTYGGYMCEAAATQIILDPRDMTTANWTLGATMTRAHTSTGADGTVNSATRLTGGAVSATNTILQTVAAAATSRTYSCYVKRVTGTGTITLKQGTATLDITALINSSTYTLVQLNDNELNVACGLQITTNGDAIDVDFNQFEAGEISTSPIPAAGTRNADVLSYPFTGNVLSTIGTAYAEIYGSWKSPSSYILISTGTGQKYMGRAGNTTSCTIYDGTTTVTKSGLTDTSTAIRRRATSWGSSGLFVTGDGASLASGSFDGTMSVVGALGIGGAGDAGNFSGTIKNVQIWQVQLTDGALQALTA